MRVYKVPYNVKHEEKIFGGYLSIRQMLYLLAGVASIGIFFTGLNSTLKVMIFLMLISIWAIFAFLQIKETNADIYFLNIMKYVFRHKKHLFER